MKSTPEQPTSLETLAAKGLVDDLTARIPVANVRDVNSTTDAILLIKFIEWKDPASITENLLVIATSLGLTAAQLPERLRIKVAQIFMEKIKANKEIEIPFNTGVVLSTEYTHTLSDNEIGQTYTINPHMPDGVRYKIIMMPTEKTSFLLYDAKYQHLAKLSYATPEETLQAAVEFIRLGKPPATICMDYTLALRIRDTLNDICGIQRNTYNTLPPQNWWDYYNAYYTSNPFISFPSYDDSISLIDALITGLMMLLPGIVLAMWLVHTIKGFLKVTIEAALAIADAVLEHTSQRVAKSTLHWAVKGIVQFSLHIALALVVLPRLILRAVLSPIAFLRDVMQQTVDCIDMFKKKKTTPPSIVAGNASLWKQTKLSKKTEPAAMPDYPVLDMVQMGV